MSYKFQWVEKIRAGAKTQEFSWRMIQVEFMSVELSGLGVMIPLNLEVYVYVEIKLCAQPVIHCSLYDILHISSCAD
jgi:hypothetical protein